MVVAVAMVMYLCLSILQEKMHAEVYAIDYLPENSTTDSCKKKMHEFHIPNDKICYPLLFEICLVCVAVIGSIVSNEQSSDSQSVINR